MMDITFVTNIPAPYKHSRFEALGSMDRVNLSVYYANNQTSRHEYRSREPQSFTDHNRNSFTVGFRNVEVLVDFWSLWEFYTVETDVFVVGGWNYSAAWSALLMGNIRKIPTAVISENVSSGNKLTRWPIKGLLNLVDSFFATSNSAKQDLQSLGADKENISILPNSTDIDSFRSQLDDETQDMLRLENNIGERNLVAYVGNLELQKGVQDLVEAAEDLSDTCLMIIGDGPARSLLEDQAGDSVIFTGWVDNTELANYYAAADVFCLPTYGDTWGLVLNESLSCGTPVVTTTAAGAVGDLVKHEENGLVVQPGDIPALRESVNRLLTDDDFRNELSLRGVEDVKEYSPGRYASKLASELRDIDGIAT